MFGRFCLYGCFCCVRLYIVIACFSFVFNICSIVGLLRRNHRADQLLLLGPLRTCTDTHNNTQRPSHSHTSTQGYYCSAGSPSSTQHVCGLGNYCIAGSSAPTQCAAVCCLLLSLYARSLSDCLRVCICVSSWCACFSEFVVGLQGLFGATTTLSTASCSGLCTAVTRTQCTHSLGTQPTRHSQTLTKHKFPHSHTRRAIFASLVPHRPRSTCAASATIALSRAHRPRRVRREHTAQPRRLRLLRAPALALRATSALRRVRAHRSAAGSVQQAIIA